MNQQNNPTDLLLRIRELEKEVAHWKNQIKKQTYGLVWLDVPEAFDNDTENALPILEEVKERAITHPDGKPTHLLIEGDNYHALTCLNYTHRGKIDVIYIDPPYNTGNDGFTYKDKRILDKFPDGTTVPKDHPLRHSYWLSFMHKRLQLAKNLLKKNGIIFISIDNNEQANLKLLCDKVFGEENFVGCLPRITKKAGKTTNVIADNNDYVIIYSKSKQISFNTVEVEDKEYKNVDEYVDTRGKYKLSQTLDYDSLSYSESLDYPIKINDEFFYPGGDFKAYKERKNGNHKRADWAWRWSESLFEFGLKNGFIIVKQGKNGKRIYTKTYKNVIIERKGNEYCIVNKDRTKLASTLDLIENEFSNDNAKKELDKIFNNSVFDYSKPSSLIKRIIFWASSPTSTILDFFAGSGTTMHATMQLNAEDGGNRQCILVTNNENGICEKVTYERNRRVMCGYTNAKGEAVAGLGNSLKYYRTAFVGKHPAAQANDEDRVLLSQKAGCLLALGENTLEEVQTTPAYQFFSDGNHRHTAVYFTGNLNDFDTFRQHIETLQTNPQNRIAVYLFSWGSVDSFENEFDNLQGITLKAIPEPILEIYRNLNK